MGTSPLGCLFRFEQNYHPNACSIKAALAQNLLPASFTSGPQQSMLVMASMQSVELQSTFRRKVYF